MLYNYDLTIRQFRGKFMLFLILQVSFFHKTATIFHLSGKNVFFFLTFFIFINKILDASKQEFPIQFYEWNY